MHGPVPREPGEPERGAHGRPRSGPRGAGRSFAYGVQSGDSRIHDRAARRARQSFLLLIDAPARGGRGGRVSVLRVDADASGAAVGEQGLDGELREVGGGLRDWHVRLGPGRHREGARPGAARQALGAGETRAVLGGRVDDEPVGDHLDDVGVAQHDSRQPRRLRRRRGRVIRVATVARGGTRGDGGVQHPRGELARGFGGGGGRGGSLANLASSHRLVTKVSGR